MKKRSTPSDESDLRAPLFPCLCLHLVDYISVKAQTQCVSFYRISQQFTNASTFLFLCFKEHIHVYFALIFWVLHNTKELMILPASRETWACSFKTDFLCLFKWDVEYISIKCYSVVWTWHQSFSPLRNISYGITLQCFSARNVKPEQTWTKQRV